MSNRAARNETAPSAPDEVPFSSSEVRLSPRLWAVALPVIAGLFWLIPVLWAWIEPFDPDCDYRVPYRLSNDYWMVRRYFRHASSQDKILIVGDSVVWGHYVGKDETLSHYLNDLAGRERFSNLGVDGIHPAALMGLVEYYGRDISDHDVVLHCNLLWMSSKQHDLQTKKEFAFNHPALVPQFVPRIPCYKESLSGKIGIVVARWIPFLAWTKHLQMAYFDNTNLAVWTAEHPYDNPGAAVTLKLPSAGELPSPEPDARAWTEKGMGKFNAAWVELETSFQWRCFRRTIEILKRRGNRVFVVLGPFNEPMLTERSLEVYGKRKREAEAWFQQDGVPHAIAPALPSRLYADASHPLADGYRLMAQRLFEDEAFAAFQRTAE